MGLIYWKNILFYIMHNEMLIQNAQKIQNQPNNVFATQFAA